MKRYLAYLSALLRHKKYVFLEGRKLGLPVLRLILHDWDKFGYKMFTSYAENFYKADGSRRDGEETEAFKETWNRHQKISRHHWQAHIRYDDDGSIEVMKMPEVDILEMAADWRGAGLAYGNSDTAGWYGKTRHQKTLHPETRKRIEEIIGWIPQQ